MYKDDDQHFNDKAEELILGLDVLKFNKNTLEYTSCYCEENIYMLCLEITKKKPELLDDFSVIFISNNNRSVPLWQQKAGRGDEHVVLWDYHVVLYLKQDSESLIYDFDSLLPFPSPADFYALETFKPNLLVKDEFKHSFRFIPAKTYLDYFSSDRSHMVRA
ncbi:N-terminal glutamine amidase-domain-containing protein [Parasitella parasitica]|nr:N-terminal glutamine amidase-domain-containing protein [Parasitella parasitica]